MNHVTPVARRTVIATLTLVGVYYALAGAFALVNIVDVTRRWTRLSGDPEFPADAGLFGMVIAIGAAVWVALGIGTVWAGVRSLTGDRASRASWAVLTTIAVLVHVPWLLYRIMGTGTLARPEAALQIRLAGAQFATVALLYILGWLTTRSEPMRLESPC